MWTKYNQCHIVRLTSWTGSVISLESNMKEKGKRIPVSKGLTANLTNGGERGTGREREMQVCVWVAEQGPYVISLLQSNHTGECLYRQPFAIQTS